MGRGQSAATTTAPRERATEETPKDWTLQAARAVHGLVEYAAEHPRTNPGPWTISFGHNGNARCRSSAYEPHQPAVMVCEPAWYRFIWGPKLNDLASHLWETVARDLKEIGVKVDVPTEEERKLMYWGPMPIDIPRDGRAFGYRGKDTWSEPNRTIEARLARQEYMERLEREQITSEPFPFTFKQRRPLKEERDARLKAQMRKAGKLRKVAPPQEPLPSPWAFGLWGKGFMSASGQMYAWRTSSPDEDAHPQHREAQRLIEEQEGVGALEDGQEITNADVAHFAPIVIAPSGQYAQYSAEPFWQDAHFGEGTDAILSRFDPSGFSTLNKALHYEPDADKWADENLGHGKSYSHATALASV